MSQKLKKQMPPSSARNPPPAPASSSRRRPPPEPEEPESETDTDSEDLDSDTYSDTDPYSTEDSDTDTDEHDAEAGCRQHVRVNVNCHHAQDSAGNPCLRPTYIDPHTGKKSVSHYTDNKDHKLEDHERFCRFFPHHHGTPRKVWCIEDVTVKKEGGSVK